MYYVLLFWITFLGAIYASEKDTFTHCRLDGHTNNWFVEDISCKEMKKEKEDE